MATESETAPQSSNDPRFPLEIEGWLWIPGDGPNESYYRPDPRHELHPYQQELRRRPGLLRRLERDPQLRGVVDSLAPETRTVSDAIRSEALRSGVTPLLYRGSDRFLSSLIDTIHDAARSLGPADIASETKFHYLGSQIVPPEYLPRWVVPIDPVMLWIDTDGVITMRFTGASAGERDNYNDLIRSAQKALGYRGNEGGRPRSVDNPVAMEQSRMAAKLAHWGGFTNEMIAETFEWLPVEPDATADAATMRARRKKQIDKASRYVGDGERDLKKGIGPDWRSRVPPELRARALALARAPDAKQRRVTARGGS